jgi:hypothetical protein
MHAYACSWSTVTDGEGLVKALTWVHDMIRRDLATVRRLAAEVVAGANADAVRADLATLATDGPLWHLRMNCLRYCSFVHGHHNAESAQLFPHLRRADPALNPVIDKLEADHSRVSDLLDAVDATARQLGRDDDARPALAEALDRLADDLLAHLRFEEERISDTLRTLTWPGR